MVEIRCYKTDCRYNEFAKSNSGRCMGGNISITDEGCMDYIKRVEKNLCPNIQM